MNERKLNSSAGSDSIDCTTGVSIWCDRWNDFLNENWKSKMCSLLCEFFLFRLRMQQEVIDGHTGWSLWRLTSLMFFKIELTKKELFAWTYFFIFFEKYSIISSNGFQENKMKEKRGSLSGSNKVYLMVPSFNAGVELKLFKIERSKCNLKCNLM